MGCGASDILGFLVFLRIRPICDTKGLTITYIVFINSKSTDPRDSQTQQELDTNLQVYKLQENWCSPKDPKP